MEKLVPLVVDLDGTLLRSDILHESFWSAFRKNWFVPFVAIAKLWVGKAALKSYLELKSEIDVSLLPYDEVVIDYVNAYRSKGGRVLLVTASEKSLATKVANYLNIFDEVHGSDGTTNLKGCEKARFLTERFGADKFAYMGDALSDLHVWRSSEKAITINAGQSLRKRVNALGKTVEHLKTKENSAWPYLTVLRPHQWVKNILIFLPMIAAHQLSSNLFSKSILAFVAFSLVASSVYIVNDLFDLGADRIHPRKRSRPIASGSVPIAHAVVLALFLFIFGITLAFYLGAGTLTVLGAYYLVTTAYSLKFKSKVIIDICILAGLYTARIFAGGIATGIELSVWLLAFSIFFFFALAAVKRQAELIDMLERGKTGAEGRGYQTKDLPILSIVSLSAGYISVLVMALYINSPAVQELYSFPYTLWGICCILLYWITRVVLITHRGLMHDDPVIFALKDKVSQASFCIIIFLGVAGISI